MQEALPIYNATQANSIEIPDHLPANNPSDRFREILSLRTQYNQHNKQARNRTIHIHHSLPNYN